MLPRSSEHGLELDPLPKSKCKASERFRLPISPEGIADKIDA
jgi:hypothetical protein